MFRVAALLLLLLLPAGPAWSKVFLRWTEASLPASPLGVSAIVIPWDANAVALFKMAASRGYRVYVEVSPEQASDLKKTLSDGVVEGVFVRAAQIQDPPEQIRMLRAAYSKTKVIPLYTGKQPQMRGQTVTTSNGVLQVSSPTAQPWLDSYLAMINFLHTSNPHDEPTYTFDWELTDSSRKENGPSAEDYFLAIAESGTIHANVVLNLHKKLQQDLIAGEPGAKNIWRKMVSYLRFADQAQTGTLLPWNNVAIITLNYEAAYEAMNLMARHNIPFRVITKQTAQTLAKDLKVAIAFDPPDRAGAADLNAFASQGGTVILVDAKGEYPWQSAPSQQTEDNTTSYQTDEGRVIELKEPVTDPETFAQEVRSFTPKQDILISLWNALSTVAVPYQDSRTGSVVIELVNFADIPMRVQIQVKGSYASVRYEEPGRPCCAPLKAEKHDGSTEFVVPQLAVSGRVHLEKTESKRTPHPNK